MTMASEFRPGVRENVGLLIGIAGGTGSGKTFSAMRLAQGIAGPNGRFAVIDTEARRALHYADSFRFDHAELRAPFRPQAYAEAVLAADAAGYKAIVVDSMSHEHEGEGGLIEWAAELEARGLKSGGQWKEPKAAHKKMLNRMLQCRAHLIFCLRADDKIEIRREGGKTVIIQPEQKPIEDRWVPICEKRFMFEMTASCVLTAARPGVPIWKKLQDQHRPIFPDGQPIDERAGERLAAWASGGDATPAAPAGGQAAPPASRRSPEPAQPAPAPAQAAGGGFWTRDDLGIPGPGQSEKTKTWAHWAERCCAALATCPGPDAAERWEHDNGARLEIAANYDPEAAGRVRQAIEQARAVAQEGRNDG
jgi:AAA domain